MHGDLCLDVGHCEFYISQCLVLLYSFKLCWILFRHTVKLLGVSWILSTFAFKLCQGKS